MAKKIKASKFLPGQMQWYSDEDGKQHTKEDLAGWSCHNDRPKALCYVPTSKKFGDSKNRLQIILPIAPLIEELKRQGLING